MSRERERREQEERELLLEEFPVEGRALAEAVRLKEVTDISRDLVDLMLKVLAVSGARRIERLIAPLLEVFERDPDLPERIARSLSQRSDELIGPERALYAAELLRGVFSFAARGVALPRGNVPCKGCHPHV